MAIVYADRVQQTTITTGIGAITFSGTVLGFRSFAAGVGLGNQTYYTITDEITGDWELGLGTVGAGTFSRDTVVASSNGNALVPFAVGTKKIFVSPQAAFFATAMSLSNHAVVNHSGLPGVPAAETFTGPVHSATDHTGLTGVLSPAAHATTNHAGLPGVGDLTIAAHALTNHAGITGVGDLMTAAHALIDHSVLPGVPDTLSTQVNGAANTLSYNVPGGTLAVDGDTLDVVAAISQPAPPGFLNVTYGGVLLVNSLLIAATDVAVESRIWRTSPTVARHITKVYHTILASVTTGSFLINHAVAQTLTVNQLAVLDLIVRKLPA